MPRILDIPGHVTGKETIPGNSFGGEGGSYNAFLYFPEQDITVIVMTNKVNSNELFIVIDVVKKYITELQTERE